LEAVETDLVFQQFCDKFGRDGTFSHDEDTENFETGNLVFDFSVFFDKEVIITE
jgi:hypothetical protein